MPFVVTFKIYDPGKQAPKFQTRDRKLAYCQWRADQQKEPMVRMVPEVTCVGLTNSEKYVWLVYRVLKAIRKYYDERGRVSKEISEENLKASLALEKELDNWNTRTRFYLQGHPKSTPDSKEAFAFFQLVEAWRKRWHEYFRYKKLKDKDPKWEKQLKQDCFDMEKEIKNYVRFVIGL